VGWCISIIPTTLVAEIGGSRIKATLNKKLTRPYLKKQVGSACLWPQLLGRWRQEDHGLRLAIGKSIRPSLKQNKAKKWLEAWLKWYSTFQVKERL
jgi:hypothetical protein